MLGVKIFINKLFLINLKKGCPMKKVIKNKIIILSILLMLFTIIIPSNAKETCIKKFENCIGSYSLAFCVSSYTWCKTYYG